MCADGGVVSKEGTDRVGTYVSRLLTTAFIFLIFRSRRRWEQNRVHFAILKAYGFSMLSA